MGHSSPSFSVCILLLISTHLCYSYANVAAVQDSADTTANTPILIDVLENDSFGGPSSSRCQASSHVATGTNERLTQRNNLIFIPYSEAHSGVLGETTSSGDKAGESGDSITLVDNDSSTGWVSFMLTVEPLGLPSENIDLSSTLSLHLDDIDFKPSTYRYSHQDLTLTENIQLWFIKDPSLSGSALESLLDSSPSLLFNENTYGNYRSDGFGTTNNVKIDYSFTLEDLGVTLSDLDGLSASSSWGLFVKLSCTVSTVLTSNKSNKKRTLGNGAESFASAFQFHLKSCVVPSIITPASFGLAVPIWSTGLIEYSPSSDFAGSDTFTYQICDHINVGNSCSSAQVTVTVHDSLVDSLFASDFDYQSPCSSSSSSSSSTSTQLMVDPSTCVAWRCDGDYCAKSMDGGNTWIHTPPYLQSLVGIITSENVDHTTFTQPSVLAYNKNNELIVSYDTGATWDIYTALDQITLIDSYSHLMTRPLALLEKTQCGMNTWWASSKGTYVQVQQNDHVRHSGWDCACACEHA